MSYISKRSPRQITVQTEAEMLALNAFPGDMVQVEELKKNFILNQAPASVRLNWSSISSYGTDFVVTADVGDWVQVGSSYELVMVHNLGTLYMQATIYDRSNGDLVTYTLTVVDENVIKLVCPTSPDGRRDVLLAIDAIII